MISPAAAPDGLVVETEGQLVPLRAETETAFFSPLIGLRLTFQIDPGGEVTGFVANLNSQDISATRIGP